MDLTPTIMTGASAAPAASSPAESAPATSQEATASTPSGETQTTQAEATEQTDAPDDAGEQQATESETAEATESTDDGRFDKHPRWKQMVTQRNEARKQAESMALEKARLEGQLQALEQARQAAPAPVQQPVQTRDFDGEIATLEAKLDAGDMSLAEFNRAQRTLLTEQIESRMIDRFSAAERQKTEQAQVSQLTEGFIKANPDFVQARDSGALDAIIQTNPLHDSVSAYFALKLQQTEEAKLAAVEAAEKAAEERVRKEFAAKQSARTMTGSTSTSPVVGNGTDPELADPGKYGGINAVLTKRLLASRAASA